VLLAKIIVATGYWHSQWGGGPDGARMCGEWVSQPKWMCWLGLADVSWLNKSQTIKTGN